MVKTDSIWTNQHYFQLSTHPAKIVVAEQQSPMGLGSAGTTSQDVRAHRTERVRQERRRKAGGFERHCQVSSECPPRVTSNARVRLYGQSGGQDAEQILVSGQKNLEP